MLLKYVFNLNSCQPAEAKFGLYWGQSNNWEVLSDERHKLQSCCNCCCSIF